MNEKMCGIAYELGDTFSFLGGGKQICIDIYEVYPGKTGYCFNKVKSVGRFNGDSNYDVECLQKLIKDMRRNGYLTRAEWLEKQRQNPFDQSVESVMESSHFASMEPMDMDKAALLLEIMKNLRYFNLQDIEVIYTIIIEYGFHQDVASIANIAQFLTEVHAGKSVEDTSLTDEHRKQGKVYEFGKISKLFAQRHKDC